MKATCIQYAHNVESDFETPTYDLAAMTRDMITKFSEKFQS
jgi:hypothetical protein